MAPSVTWSYRFFPDTALSRGPSLPRKDGVLSPWDVVLMLFVLLLRIEGHWDRCSHPS